MKKRYLFINIIFAFILSFSMISITGELFTVYILPDFLDFMPSDPEKEFGFIMDISYGYFNRAFAFSFFIFIALITPVISSYKFKTSLLLNVLASVLVSLFFWFIVRAIVIQMMPDVPNKAYYVQLNPFYTNVSYGAAVTVFLVVFLFSFLKKKT